MSADWTLEAQKHLRLPPELSRRFLPEHDKPHWSKASLTVDVEFNRELPLARVSDALENFDVLFRRAVTAVHYGIPVETLAAHTTIPIVDPSNGLLLVEAETINPLRLRLVLSGIGGAVVSQTGLATLAALGSLATVVALGWDIYVHESSSTSPPMHVAPCLVPAPPGQTFTTARVGNQSLRVPANTHVRLTVDGHILDLKTETTP